MTDITDALERLKSQRILLVGDYMLDEYVYGETGRVSREAPVIVVRRERTAHRVGGAANTAVNLAALGIHVTVVGTLGGDEAGERLRGQLSDAGVDTNHLLVSEHRTPRKTRVLAGSIGLSRQQVLRIDDEPDGPIDASVASRLADMIGAEVKQHDALLVSDYGLGTLTPAVIESVRASADNGAIVCVDSRYQLGAYRGVTAVTPNVVEASASVGYELTSVESVDLAGARLVDSLDCQQCLLTQGRGGMTLYRSDRGPSHVEIIGEDEVTDVTGAGDTVLATFGAALAAGLGSENAMRLANCAAGIVVHRSGTASATPAEIVRLARESGMELLPWER